MALALLRKGSMRYFLCFLLVFLISFTSLAEVISFDKLPFNKTVKENILNGEIFSKSQVETFTENGNEMQSLKFVIAGIHPKSCEYALKKLSLYEEYSNFLDFVKISKYDEKTQELDFFIQHSLLPYTMELTFSLPRVKKIGDYPFRFKIGILKDLSGMIYVRNFENRCFFYTTASWKGPYTKIPGFIFEIFSQTLSKISMELLFRISSSLAN